MNANIKNEQTIAVNPVLPPSVMPTALSTYATMLDVPNVEPIIVPAPSIERASFICGNVPSLFTIEVFLVKPINFATLP